MTDLISFVTSTGSNSSTSGANVTGLAENFDTFLTLLTAQMQNQDPLAPLDSTEFTNQLVQFSSVEQQIQTNQSIESLLAATNASTGASLSGYLGQTVELNSTGTGFYGDDVNWSYRLADDAAKATLVIQNIDGKVVYSEEVDGDAGSHEFTWDGKDLNGDTVDDGQVYYAAITAEDANGDSIEAAVTVLARVTGVDMSYGDPAITTTAGIYGYADVLRITS